jgi:sterol desaturase/sphingolipid hydroxylase (fatty acid hydroxylase superfamily)
MMNDLNLTDVAKQKNFDQPLNFHPLNEREEEKRLITENRPERVRIFKSDFLERLTLVKWQTIFKVWVPVIFFLVFWGNFNYPLSVGQNLGFLFLGILLWTLAEYLIHRFPFHWSPDNKFGKQLVYSMHGNHHDDPFDPLRGVMPIAPAIIYITILYFIFKLIFPVTILHVLFAGFLIGYLCYDGIHYYTHHAKPKNKIGKYLRRVHLVHHVHDDTMFGISSPLWDILLGTYIKKGYKVPREF